MRVDEAARILKDRAREMLMKRIRELGVSVQLPKDQESQESCDSGLPDSCAESLEEEKVQNMEEMTKSVTEMSIISEEEEDETIEDEKLEMRMKLKNEEEDLHEVEDTVLECLETSLLKLRAPKDEQFLRRLSQTFSPTARRKSILNDSTCDDSFDRPVPGSVPLVFRTPRRELSSPYVSPVLQFDDSFDRPVPGSVPLIKTKRQSILKAIDMNSPNVSISMLAQNFVQQTYFSDSANKSYDVFETPPTKEEKPRAALKHSRIDDLV